MERIINVSNVLDSPSALTQEQGKKVYELISEAIRANDKVFFGFKKSVFSITYPRIPLLRLERTT